MSALSELLPSGSFELDDDKVVLRPANVDELARGLAWARSAQKTVEVVRTRLAAIAAPDLTSCLVAAQGGALLSEVEQRLAASGLTLGPVTPGAMALTVSEFLEGRHGGLRPVPGGRLETAALALEAAWHTGEIYRSHASPRAAAGPDLDFALLAGGGALGFITGAVLRVQPVPTATEAVAVELPSAQAAALLLHRALGHDALPWTAAMTRRGDKVVLSATFRNLAFRAHRDARCLRDLAGAAVIEPSAPALPPGPEQELAWDALPHALDGAEHVSLHRIARESVVVRGAARAMGVDLDAAPAKPAWLTDCAKALATGASP